DPGRTIDELKTWLEAHGYVVSRGAVWNWKQRFDEQCQLERLSNAGKIAQAWDNLAKNDDAVTKIPQAAVMAVNQQIFETINRLALQGEVSPQDLASIALACQRTTLSQVRIEDVREQMASKFKTEGA